MSHPDRGERYNPQKPAAQRADRRIAVWLAVCTALAYALFHNGYWKSSDEVGVYETMRAVADRGELSVPSMTGFQHVFTGHDGQPYSHFAIGQSLLALPFYSAGKAAGSVVPRSWTRAMAGRTERLRGPWRGSEKVWTVLLYGPVISGALVGLFFLFERRLGVSLFAALAASVVLAASTYVATMSLYFLRHTTEAFCVLGAFYGFYGYRRTGESRHLWLGCALAAMVPVVRLPSAIAGPALGGYLIFALYSRAKQSGVAPNASTLAAIFVPAALGALLHCAVNLARWGTWLESPMLAQSGSFSTPIYVGLAGFLLSPGVSIFVYSPPLLVAPFAVPAFWRDHRAECIATLALSLSFLFFCAGFEKWTGLWSAPGPRYLFVLTPLLLLPLGGWLEKVGRRGRAAVVAVALVGLGIQLLMMIGSWPFVIERMGYRFFPDKSFVFQVAYSPVIGFGRAVANLELDPWIWWLWRGWPGYVGSPTAALAVVAAWTLSFALCACVLVRCVRAHPAIDAPQEPSQIASRDSRVP